MLMAGHECPAAWFCWQVLKGQSALLRAVKHCPPCVHVQGNILKQAGHPECWHLCLPAVQAAQLQCSSL